MDKTKIAGMAVGLVVAGGVMFGGLYMAYKEGFIRLKGLESFYTVTTPNPKPTPLPKNAYSFGGYAEGSGGTIPTTNWGAKVYGDELAERNANLVNH